MAENIKAATSIREPQDNIPQTKQQRDKLLQLAAEYVREKRPVGPMSLDELRSHCKEIIKAKNINSKYMDFMAVILNNQVWRDSVAGIAYDKRLLLLPKCLRNEKNCQGNIDEYGLICEQCGSCVIGEFKTEAERLGYAVLIAEGSPVVMSLIASGKIEAVIGVSCMDVLEKTFPYMEAGAIPGIAIPLLQDGCANTSVDEDWVWDAIYENSQIESTQINLKELQKQVENWFTEKNLEKLFPKSASDTEKLAIEWLSKAGKRWRPFLAVCAYCAVKENNSSHINEEVHRMAIAVECFHKASLIHDDIEDSDSLRYGQKTLHAEYGIPIALNVGDFLLGEGYRLLAELNIDARIKTRMLAAASQGHRSLCIGQGNELTWMSKPKQLAVDEVIEIFEKKTSPAFEVALKLGAVFAQCKDSTEDVLKQYSRSLGIAYQIKDDIDDFISQRDALDLNLMRPSILLALGYEQAKEKEKKFLESLWKTEAKINSAKKEVKEIFDKYNIEHKAFMLMESYKQDAIKSLSKLENSSVKSLLRKVIGKIFKDMELMGCCNEYKNRDVTGSEQSRKNIK